jgi:hypothetical protein
MELQTHAVLLRHDLSELVRRPDERLPPLSVELRRFEVRARRVIAVAGHRDEDHVLRVHGGGQLRHLAGDADDVRPVSGPVQATVPVHGAGRHLEPAPAHLLGEP